MRVVPDTNTIISGLLWRGAPRQVMDAARDGILELCTCPELLSELADVLSRPKFSKQLKLAHVSATDLVEGYKSLAREFELKPIAPVIFSDPDDDVVLACALVSESEIIVSGDSHLLDLVEHKDVRIMTATNLLKEIFD